MTRELMLSNLVLTITRKQHVTCAVSEILELFFFSKSSCWLSAGSLVLILLLSVLGLWQSEVLSLWFMSISKRRWLMCDSRWEARKSVMAGNDTSWTVSCNCLFEVFCWEFLCRVSGQMERHSETHWFWSKCFKLQAIALHSPVYCLLRWQSG